MDFHAHQDRAKAASRRLAALFVVSLVLVVAAVNGAAALAWLALGAGTRWPPYFMLTNTAVTLLIVFGGAWVELHRLRESGAALAVRLGARALDAERPLHRRLRDVAEEVSIGAGIPVPALYVLDDESINALAAGERPGLAAVVVTRGALEQLSRAELQGVVAHEVAHIVGGDPELNVRLTGALYGLYSLRLAGTGLLGRALARDAGPLMRLGAVRIVALVGGALLSAVGMLGVVGAQVLRAGIGRQREFLADALAVQITRDRDGLGQALRRIAGRRASPLKAGYAALVSHFLLVQPGGLREWFDTHPSLAERIRRLYGRWMPPIHALPQSQPTLPLDEAPTQPMREPFGEALPFLLSGLAGDTVPLEPAGSGAGVRAPALGTDAEAGCERGGRVHGGIAYDCDGREPRASALIAQIRSASLGFETARRWLIALVAGSADEEPDAALRASLQWLVSPDGAALRVPLLELLLARVRPWPGAHRRELLDRCRHAVERDGSVHSAEWIFYTLARARLLPGPAASPRQRGAPPSKLAQSRALAALFAVAAAVGEASARSTRDALAHAATMLDVPPPASTPDEVRTTELALALDALLRLPPLDKPILLKILLALARAPGDPRHEAFVRAVAAAIDCPMPRGAGRPVRLLDTDLLVV